MEQQLVEVEVKRRISAHANPSRLPLSKEFMYRSKETLNVGPQLGKVDNKLFSTTGIP